MRDRATRWARLLLLLALAGTQAYASTAQLVRLCTMAPEPATCHCPPSHQEDGPSEQEGPALQTAGCCERHVVRATASAAVVELGRSIQVAHPPVSVAVAPPAPVSAVRSPLASRWPPSQGPPLFLKVRTLLI